MISKYDLFTDVNKTQTPGLIFELLLMFKTYLLHETTTLYDPDIKNMFLTCLKVKNVLKSGLLIHISVSFYQV